jgi:hypothetical protein
MPAFLLIFVWRTLVETSFLQVRNYCLGLDRLKFLWNPLAFPYQMK